MVEHPGNDVVLLQSIAGNEWDAGLVVLSDGSVKQILQCRGVNPLSLSESEFSKLTCDFARFATHIQADIQIIATLKRVDEEFLQRYLILVRGDDEYLKWYSDYIEKWFDCLCDKTELISVREFYVVVSYRPDDVDEEKIEQDWYGTSVRVYPNSLEELELRCSRVEDELDRLSLRPIKLTRTALLHLLSSHGVLEPDAESAPAVEVLGDILRVSEKYAAVLYLEKLPSEFSLGWFDELLNSNSEHTLSMFLHSPGNNQIDLSVYVRVEADTIKQLRASLGAAKRAFSRFGAVLSRTSQNALALWHSSLPLGLDEQLAVHNVSPTMLSSFWPFTRLQCGTPDGVPFALAVGSREPVLFNPFFRGMGKDNNNVLFTGVHSGKFAMALLMLRLMPLGARFIVLSDSIRRLNNFRFMCDLLGSDICETVSLQQGSEHVLNPFDPSPKNRPSRQEMVCTLLDLFDHMLASPGQQTISVQEKSILEHLIRVAYDDAHSRGTVPTLSEFVDLASRRASIEQERPIRDILMNLVCGLSLYTAPGTYSSFLDGQTNIKLDKMSTIIDTGVRGDSRREKALSRSLLELIMREAQWCVQRGKRLCVMVEQGHGLMASDAGMEMLAEIAVRVKQYGACFAVSTQRLRNLTGDSGRIVLQEAQTKLLFRMDSSDSLILKDMISLSERATRSLMVEQRSDSRDARALMMVGCEVGFVNLSLSPLEYWICTEEPIRDLPRRMEQIREIKAKNPDLTHTDACRQAAYSLSCMYE